MAMRRPSALLGALLLVAAGAARADLADWWLTPDQQGRLAYDRGDYALAAQRFVDPTWKGLAYYAAGDFTAATAYFTTLDSPFGYFYLGNALAHQNRLPEAIRAYEAALASDPQMAAARFNLDWVRGLAELDAQEYDDAGGTGGQLGADDVVFDDRAKDAQASMSSAEAAAQGLTDEEIEAIWMRRVQTTPAEFLALKFAYQQQLRSGADP